MELKCPICALEGEEVVLDKDQTEYVLMDKEALESGHFPPRFPKTVFRKMCPDCGTMFLSNHSE